MKNQIIIEEFWEKVVDYYYDHVHWESGSPKSIKTWVKDQYSGQVDMENRCIKFDDEAKKNWFVLRWS